MWIVAGVRDGGQQLVANVIDRDAAIEVIENEVEEWGTLTLITPDGENEIFIHEDEDTFDPNSNGGCHDWHAAEELFNDFLDCGGSVSVAGMDFYPSTILRECDPIAYRASLFDFLDGCDIDSDKLDGEPSI